MSESLFAKNLAYFKQELRDLKTGHPIALGSLDFYQKSDTITTPSQLAPGVYVRLTIENGEPAYPYAQVFIRETSGGSYWSYYQEQNIVADGTIMQYYFAMSGSKTYEVVANCTSNFTLIVKDYEDSDWIEEE